MRYDLRVLWIDDTPGFFEETKDVLEMYAEDAGISVSFEYEQEASNVLDNIQKAKDGFKVYDVFFIDYSLSGVVGNDIISKLRISDIDADILFYSSEHEATIRKIMAEKPDSYEGVYVASRENFDNKSNYLIKKNFRRLLSLTNIRGALMDQTSENDYAMKSYILQEYDGLNSEQKRTISEMLVANAKAMTDELEGKVGKDIAQIEKEGITNINKALGLPSYLFPLSLRYIIFEKIVEFKEESIFEENSIKDYLEKVNKIRNKLAHKKLDICKTQKYILYYDDIKQYRDRQCPEDDCLSHTDENKIGIAEWDELRKRLIGYGKCFDAVERKLEEVDE